MLISLQEHLDIFTFANVGTPAGGMFQPTGVDNYDTNPTYGYFVGVDVGRSFYHDYTTRVINPGTTPTLAAAVTIDNTNICSPSFGSLCKSIWRNCEHVCIAKSL